MARASYGRSGSSVYPVANSHSHAAAASGAGGVEGGGDSRLPAVDEVVVAACGRCQISICSGCQTDEASPWPHLPLSPSPQLKTRLSVVSSSESVAFSAHLGTTQTHKVRSDDTHKVQGNVSLTSSIKT